MKHAYPILYKVLVREFYRQHATLFILAIAFFGGVMSGREHLALGLFLISTPENTLILFTVWLPYAVKAFAFIAQALTKSENEFIYHFRLYPRANQFGCILKCWMILFCTLYGLSGISFNTVNKIRTTRINSPNAGKPQRSDCRRHSHHVLPVSKSVYSKASITN